LQFRPGPEGEILSWLKHGDCQIPGAPELQLPEIRPSYFKDGKNILPGNASVEWMSAHFGIREIGRKIAGPYWVGPGHGDDRQYVIGAWDVGIYELRLEQPVIEYVILREGLADGKIAAYYWTPVDRTNPEALAKENHDDPTPWRTLAFGQDKTWNADLVGKETRGLNIRRGQTPLPGHAVTFAPQKYAVSGHYMDQGNHSKTLLWFQSARALPLQEASVTRHAIKVSGTLFNASDTITVFEVDLDHDGIADFVRWFLYDVDRGYNSFEDAGLNGISIVFVNINGEWYRFETDYEQESGC
jgi:hypothetical protein